MSFPKIISPANERIKRAARLRRAAHRSEQQQMLIDGIRELRLAATGNVVPAEVFFCDTHFSPGDKAFLGELAQRGSSVFEVSEPVIERLAYGDRTEGIVAVAPIPHRSIDELLLPASPLVVVLEGVEKPGNVGAVIRTADAAGAAALIVVDPGTDLYNPNAIRASLGTIFRLPVCAADAETTLTWLRSHQLQLVVARLDAERPPWEIDLKSPTALVLGAEATGLSSRWAAEHAVPVRLPMLGAADSLNVSATAAALLYEAVRQRSM